MKSTVVKRRVSIVLCIIMILSALPLTALSSFAATSGDWEYSVSGGNAVITGYNGSASSLTIPSKLGGNTVTEIDKYALSNNKYIKNVTVPSSVTSIRTAAFQDCKNLSSITLPSNMNSIGPRAFEGCIALKSISIPNGLNSIEYYAFNGCKTLSSVTIPNSVNYIYEGAFYNCPALKTLTIPASVSSINKEAFSGTTSMNNVTVYYNPNCSYYSIGNSIKTVIIPSGVTEIKRGAFTYYYPNIQTVSISNTVKTIRAYAFNYCPKIKSLIIPKEVTTIETNAFADCTGLESINVSSENKNYCSVDGILFNKYKTVLMKYPANKTGSGYSIPNTVTTIDECAFSFNNYLNSVQIPVSVKTIKDRAFSSCKNLIGIKIPKTVTSVGNFAYGWDLGETLELELGGTLDYLYEYEDDFRMKNCVISGEKNSAAQTYASDYLVPFYLPGTFPDVKKGEWYYDAVSYVANKGYISGYANCRFGPADVLKRQDFVLILARIAGADLTKYENKTSKFSDVKKGAYYYSAVIWAVENGIIGGYSNGKFGVGDNITREQVATILYRYIDSPTVANVDKTLSKFKDYKKISSYAKAPLAWAVQNGVISGMADGRIAPSEGASRAQIAVIIMRLDENGMFFDDWQSAFKSFILNKTFLKHGNTSLGYGELDDPLCSVTFALHDMDNDSVPELIIFNGFNGRNLRADYYFKYTNKVVKYCGSSQDGLYASKLCHGLFAEESYSGTYLGEYASKYTEVVKNYHVTISNGSITKTTVYIKGRPINSSGWVTIEMTDNNSLYNVSQTQKFYLTTKLYKNLNTTSGWSDFVTNYK